MIVWNYRRRVIMIASLIITILIISVFNLEGLEKLFDGRFTDSIHSKLSYLYTGALAGDESSVFKFRIYSHNIRVDTWNRFHHEHRWSDRKAGVVEQIQRTINNEEQGYVPTLIGLQESKYHQLKDILKGLNSRDSNHLNWTHYGVGRDDGDTLGEYTPILYDSSEWILINGTSKWLSDKPDIPSKSWGASKNRVITFTTFQNIQSGDFINYINTHLDHKSEKAKEKSANLIIDWVKSIPNDYPTVLSGDFNFFKEDISYKLIETLMSDSKVTFCGSDPDRNQENSVSYTGFEPNSKPTLIDFQWFYNSGHWEIFVQSFKYLSNVIDDLKFSDHKPLEAIYQITKNTLKDQIPENQNKSIEAYY